MASAAGDPDIITESENKTYFYELVESSDSDSSDDEEIYNLDNYTSNFSTELERPFSELVLDRHTLFTRFSEYSFFNLDDKHQEFWKNESIRFYNDLLKIQNEKVPSDVKIIIHIGGYSLEEESVEPIIKKLRNLYVMLILPLHKNSDNNLLVKWMKKMYPKIRGLKIYKCPFPSVYQFSQNIPNLQLKTKRFPLGKCILTDYIKTRPKKTGDPSIINKNPSEKDMEFVDLIEETLINISLSGVKFIIYNDAIVSNHKIISKKNEIFGVICHLFNKLKKLSSTLTLTEKKKLKLIMMEPLHKNKRENIYLWSLRYNKFGIYENTRTIEDIWWLNKYNVDIFKDKVKIWS